MADHDTHDHTGIPGCGPPADILDIPTAETDSSLVLAPDGAGGVEFRAESGGGGLAQSFIGYNTVGGSWETSTTRRWLCKSVTLAGAGTIASVDAHIRVSTDQTVLWSASILADNSSAPGRLLSGSQMGSYRSTSSSVPSAGEWLAMPMGAYLAAGTYWICVSMGAAGAGGVYDIAYDGSGSDQYFTASIDQVTSAYPSAWAITTGSRKYSIRANLLS